jgi:hypothetical protein
MLYSTRVQYAIRLAAELAERKNSKLAFFSDFDEVILRNLETSQERLATI